MRLQLLGTGSADGWPNPFCKCVSCESLRQTGKARAASCALIDEEILIDWGPTLANSASRFGLSLNHVRHVLFTHGHPDHLAPEFLLWRSWIDDLAPLHIYGPAHALARFDHWMDPAAPVELHGERLDRILVQCVPEFSRSYLQQLIEQGTDEILNQYNTLLYKRDTYVQLKKQGQSFYCTIKNADAYGRLWVQDAMQPFFEFGEVEWVLNP